MVWAWLTSVVILAGALSPASVHRLLMAGVPGAPDWAEICSAQGTRLILSVERADDGPAHDSQGAHLFGHCPWCALHASSFAPPPVPALAPHVPALRHVTPTLFLAAPAPLFAWRSPQPRGPPLTA